MSVTSVDKDFDNLTMTLVADFTAPIEKVWELWSDPRKLERWWGPPTYPATVLKHELSTGGAVTYFMTSPEGEKFHGLWQITAVNPPKSIEFRDLFADAEGNPTADMPAPKVRMQLTQHGDGTRMEILSIFHSRAEMDQLDNMGASEGIRQAVSQMDALLAG